MATRADFPNKQAFLDKLTEALSQGTKSPVVRELMHIAFGEPDWGDDALKLFECRKRFDETIGPEPTANIWTALLSGSFGWTKKLLPYILGPRVQGSVIGIALTAALTYFAGGGTGSKTSVDMPQLISDEFAKELNSKVKTDIDQYVKSEKFNEAVKAAMEAAKTKEKK